MMRISWIVIVFGLLTRYGSTYPSHEDISVSDCENEIMESSSYAGNLISNLDVVERAEMMSSNVESLMDMDSLVDVESLASMDSLANMESLVNMDYMMDNVQSSISNAASVATNLMDYASLINQDMLMSVSEKAEYLKQLSQFSPMQMGAMTELFGMLKDSAVSHFQFKMAVIRAAKEKLALAMEALAEGNISAVNEQILSVISEMQNCCPICRMLKYAMDNDPSMLPFVGSMSQSILSRMEMNFGEIDESDSSISI